jgi:hypothetical protein
VNFFVGLALFCLLFFPRPWRDGGGAFLSVGPHSEYEVVLEACSFAGSSWGCLAAVAVSACSSGSPIARDLAGAESLSSPLDLVWEPGCLTNSQSVAEGRSFDCVPRDRHPRNVGFEAMKGEAHERPTAESDLVASIDLLGVTNKFLTRGSGCLAARTRAGDTICQADS